MDYYQGVVTEYLRADRREGALVRRRGRGQPLRAQGVSGRDHRQPNPWRAARSPRCLAHAPARDRPGA